jgi:5-deoxy-D-glucuronate isomerase
MIHRNAPPNHLAPDELHVRPGPDGVSLSVDPARAGWRYLAFRAVALGAGERFDVGGAGSELALVVLAGGGVSLVPDYGDELILEGRRTVFDGKPWAAYLPPGRRGHVTAAPLDTDGQVVLAIAEAPASGREGVAGGAVLIRPGDVEVEIRGAGNATRRIHHIIKPEFPADRLEVVEVYTPDGNRSSWPPHKHDVDDLPAVREGSAEAPTITTDRGRINASKECDTSSLTGVILRRVPRGRRRRVRALLNNHGERTLVGLHGLPCGAGPRQVRVVRAGHGAPVAG